MIDLDWKKDININKDKTIILAIKFIHPFEDEFNYAVTEINLNADKTNINNVKYLDFEKYIENLNGQYEILGIDLGDVPEDYCFDEEVYISWFKTDESAIFNKYKLKITLNEDDLDIEIELLDENGIYKDEVYKTESEVPVYTLKFINNIKKDENIVKDNIYVIVDSKEILNGIDIFNSKQLCSYYKERFGFKNEFISFERDKNFKVDSDTNIGMNELIYNIYMESKMRNKLRDYNNPDDILEENKTTFEKILLNKIMEDYIEDIVNVYTNCITKSMGITPEKLPNGEEPCEYIKSKRDIYRRVLTDVKFKKYDSLEDFIYLIVKEVLREYSNKFFNENDKFNAFVPYKIKNMERFEITSDIKVYYDSYYKRLNIEIIRLSLINYKEYIQDVYTPSLYGFRLDLN